MQKSRQTGSTRQQQKTEIRFTGSFKNTKRAHERGRKSKTTLTQFQKYHSVHIISYRTLFTQVHKRIDISTHMCFNAPTSD